MRSQEEFRLSCVVADTLRLGLPADVLWSHFPAGENRSKVTGGRLKRMGLARGWPDYLIIHNGRLLAVELKIGKGPQSPEQKAVQAGLEAQGLSYAVCRCLDDVEAFLTGQGVRLRARVA